MARLDHGSQAVIATTAALDMTWASAADSVEIIVQRGGQQPQHNRVVIFDKR
jgi:hypothetical protein